MGHGQQVRFDPVLAHQHPARKPLFNFVQAVAGCELGYLHTLDLGVTIEHQAQLGRGIERLEKSL